MRVDVEDRRRGTAALGLEEEPGHRLAVPGGEADPGPRQPAAGLHGRAAEGERMRPDLEPAPQRVPQVRHALPRLSAAA